MQIQYLGFQLNSRGREYLYRVANPKAEDREFSFTIPNAAFNDHRVPYQDAADVCYQKLRKDLELETSEKPLSLQLTVTNQDLLEYRERHRPARKRA